MILQDPLATRALNVNLEQASQHLMLAEYPDLPKKWQSKRDAHNTKAADWKQRAGQPEKTLERAIEAVDSGDIGTVTGLSFDVDAQRLDLAQELAVLFQERAAICQEAIDLYEPLHDSLVAERDEKRQEVRQWLQNGGQGLETMTAWPQAPAQAERQLAQQVDRNLNVAPLVAAAQDTISRKRSMHQQRNTAHDQLNKVRDYVKAVLRKKIGQ